METFPSSAQKPTGNGCYKGTMAKQLDKILVVDIESTCWEGDPRPGQSSEIIEVGVCLLEVRTWARSEKESLLVKPTTSTVSAFCTRLTTLTREQVETGVPFLDACNWLKKKFLGHRRCWASWGDYDRRMFESQCQERGVPYPFGPTHLNVKNLFALKQGLPRELGMPQALEHLGLPLEGTHHRGHDDAWNIAAILGELLRNDPFPPGSS
jgi:inhibitor of KinA sporulation pathway (predicted exonuclease)